MNTATRLPRWDNLLKQSWLLFIAFIVTQQVFAIKSDHLDEWYLFVIFSEIFAALLLIRTYRPARTLLQATAPFMFCFTVSLGVDSIWPAFMKRYEDVIGMSWAFASIWLVTFIIMSRNQKKAIEAERLKREAEAEHTRFIEAQNAELERLVAARTAELNGQKDELEQALVHLQAAQNQLIQSEKMASLGELTAGIAHEIQNPLNFVNNFSEVSTELVSELREEREKGEERDKELEAELLDDLTQNLQKITHHGKRASSIVRGMLEHSRTSTGERQLTDLNALCDEYLRLAYQGLRAKDKSFNADFKTDLAPDLEPIGVVPQDIGRVLLNLFNNAFYAVRQRQQTAPADYQPTVSVSTRRTETGVEIRVRDNGMGIPESVRAKIFQPFFTTKPTGEGTGLGLSLSYDIVTKGHGGTLDVESVEGEGTTFIVKLPG